MIFLHMDLVEILLLWVVGFSVLFFLIIQNLEESNKNRHEEEKDDQKEITSVGAADFSEQQVFLENSSDNQEARVEAVSENNLNSDSEKSNFRSEISTGEYKDSIFRSKSDCEEELFDDWEGIERTELENIFGKAVVFLSSNSVNADLIDEDLRLQLYGLQKVVLDGPCHGSQPMALKISARAKWNAWQKLGNINREKAMEMYVSILSEAIPDWKGESGQAIQDNAEIAEGLTSALQQETNQT